MTTAPEPLPDHARLWIFQADRKFTTKELAYLNVTMAGFVASWSAHGVPLQAAFWIKYDQFLILAVDESSHGASGCSIDSSVALIRKLESEIGVSLLDRSKIAVKQQEGIRLFELPMIKKAVADGLIHTNDIVFNNAVASFGEWKNQWEITAVNSWMKRFFNLTTA